MRREAAGSCLELLLAHRLCRGFAGNGDERVVKAGPLDRQGFNARAAVEQGPEQRFGPTFGKLEDESAAFRARASRNGRTPRAVALACLQADYRAQPRAGLVDSALKRDLALGDDR